MRLSDLEYVVDIERGTLSPWSVSSLADECRVANGLSFVAVNDDIVGWCCCRTIWPEAELLKITVSPVKRGLGIGYMLLKKMLTELACNRFNTLFLEVRAGNRAALQFYQRNDFFQVGLRCDYYSDPLDNALVLRRDILL